jgi:hypothetical protein
MGSLARRVRPVAQGQEVVGMEMQLTSSSGPSGSGVLERRSLTPDREALGRPAVVDPTTALADVISAHSATAVAALCAAVIREGYGAAPHGTPES